MTREPSADFEAAVSELGDVPGFAGPRSASVIAAAEATLGVTFPPDLRAFLARYGGGWLGDRPYAGLGLDDPELDLVARTLADRETLGIAPAWVRLSDDGGDHQLYVVCDPDDPVADGVIMSLELETGTTDVFATNVGELLDLDAGAADHPRPR